MTHDELLAKMAEPAHTLNANDARNVYLLALLAVVEVHTPNPISLKYGDAFCNHCMCYYPCKTIKTIREVLDNA